MINDLIKQLKDHISSSVRKHFPEDQEMPDIEIEIPSEKEHGDTSTNLALKSAKILKKPPLQLAEIFLKDIQADLKTSPLREYIEGIEIKKPGFINFTLSIKAVYKILQEVLEKKDFFGSSSIGQGISVQIEFVSANPTGPLSVAHARQAAVGDALANILNFVGYKVHKEFYVNDEGNQINILGRSIQLRAQELLGETIDFPADCYQGEYIKDMASSFMQENGINKIDGLARKGLVEFSQYGVNYLMNVIKNDLNDFGVHFDNWTYQSQVATKDKILEMIKSLTAKDFIYEADGALWFRSTVFGDDKDRVLRKSDGSYTYLTPDIVYHKNKYDRGYKKIYNIWGPDHHGYIPRLKAAVQALGHDASSLEVLIVQLATIYKQGKPVSMSTRRGQYISLREVVDEVGPDAGRFFFLMRNIKAHLDFDLELAKKESPENPVYYIQYAHARIHSIIEKAANSNLTMKTKDFCSLRENEEIELIKKISEWPLVVISCSKVMDVFGLVSYLMELAACFHKFYDKHRVIDSDNPALSAERLALIESARIVLANGMRLLGVKAPKKM